MFSVTAGHPGDLVDIGAFIDTLNTLDLNPVESARGLFTTDEALTVARAPGRLDLMGGIADYSGSLVLQYPIAEAALCGVQSASARKLRIVSLGGEGRTPDFACHLDELFPGGAALSYEDARTWFARDPERSWAAYVAGSLIVLAHERGLAPGVGLNILIDSAVPEGKGVSSSAAIEVATMTALNSMLGLGLTSHEIALLCQRVENLVVGAPCGVMDQIASSCGEAGALLAIRCQPAEILSTLAIPADLGVWGIDSGLRHAVSGADYGTVRAAAFMGKRLLSALPDAGLTEIDHLANLTPHVLLPHEEKLPEMMTGAEFLTRFKDHGDPVTLVLTDREYPVRAATVHPVVENHRVETFGTLLGEPSSAERNRLLGELMYQSHASYTRCGLGSSGTDRLVALIQAEAPRAPRFWGAKITGGGSGGTVALLGDADAGARVAAIAEVYARETGKPPYVFSGSSPGAARFGTLTLSPV